MDRKSSKKYPIGASDYKLCEEVGQGVSATDEIRREAQTMILVNHPNVLRAHCSFVADHNLWVVMPYMSGGSCLHIMKSAYPDGFEETAIATFLREVLKALEYLHSHGHIHRDVKAGNILVDASGAVKLGDFGVSACLFDSGDRQRTRITFVGTPCWMAPEVMEQLHGYDFKADIWSFGITALELAHGHAPFSKFPPMKALLMQLKGAPPAYWARSQEFLARTVLDGLPPLGDRMRALKLKEADRLAQKKMPYGEKEERSQNEYKRGISAWNFDLEDLKAQASLIQDDEEIRPSKEQTENPKPESGNHELMEVPSYFQSPATIHSLRVETTEKSQSQPPSIPVPPSATSSNTPNVAIPTVHAQLQSLLQQNAVQRDHIVNLLKYLNSGETPVHRLSNVSFKSSNNGAEKFVLERQLNTIFNKEEEERIRREEADRDLG